MTNRRLASIASAVLVLALTPGIGADSQSRPFDVSLDGHASPVSGRFAGAVGAGDISAVGSLLPPFEVLGAMAGTIGY